MQSSVVRAGGILVVGLVLTGCATVEPMIGSREVALTATVESFGDRETRVLDDEGLVRATLGWTTAFAEFDQKWNRYWNRLGVQLAPGEAQGEAVWELKEPFRVREDGTYVVRLDGVIESGPVPIDALSADLSVAITLRSVDDALLLEESMHRIQPRTVVYDQQQWMWISPADALKPMEVQLKTGQPYEMHAKLILKARRVEASADEPVAVGGGFRVAVEHIRDVEERHARASSLTQDLLNLWNKEDPNSNQDPTLAEAAQALATLFFGEAVGYVDVHAPRENWQACYEHARIVREWYEARMRLDPNLGRWFRMTTVRRHTPIIWQSSNLITPNVAEPPDRWLDDGSGIVLEPKPTITGSFYGRAVTADAFRMWGLRPKLQQTAQQPSQPVS